MPTWNLNRVSFLTIRLFVRDVELRSPGHMTDCCKKSICIPTVFTRPQTCLSRITVRIILGCGHMKNKFRKSMSVTQALNTDSILPPIINFNKPENVLGQTKNQIQTEEGWVSLQDYSDTYIVCFAKPSFQVECIAVWVHCWYLATDHVYLQFFFKHLPVIVAKVSDTEHEPTKGR